MGNKMDMSELNHKTGQVFMAGMPGFELDEETRNLIRDFNLGGIILFSRNISDPVQLAKLCRDITETSLKYHGNRIFIAVDQEGGRVARLRDNFTAFPGNEAIGMDNDPVARAIEFATVTAREMRMSGFNMDMAPVMDVRDGELDKHLEGRIFSDDPETVSMLGGTVIKHLQQNRIMAVAKHFPGLGKAQFDPHLDSVVIDSDISDIETKDLPPFISAIRNDVSAIMTSHAIYPALDPAAPATLSGKILTGLLRKRLGFQGLIITDDLEMGAVSISYGVCSAAFESFMAGADILLICKDQKQVTGSIEMLKEKVLESGTAMERLNESLHRIKYARSKFL